MAAGPPAKQRRLEEPIAANVIVQFESAEGETAGARGALWRHRPGRLCITAHAGTLRLAGCTPKRIRQPPAQIKHLTHTTPEQQPSHCMLLFWLPNGAGPQLDLPHNVTPAQLEVLLQGLLQNEEKQPYSFYIQEQVGIRVKVKLQEVGVVWMHMWAPRATAIHCYAARPSGRLPPLMRPRPSGWMW